MSNPSPSPRRLAKERRKARERRWRRIREKLLLPWVKLFAAAVRGLSLESAQLLGDGIGGFLARVPGSRRRRVQRHLEIAFPPGEYDKSFRRRVLRESYRSMVKLFLEALWVPNWNPARDDARVEVADTECWEQTLRLARERGNGLVVFTAHLGTAELLARWFCNNIGLPVLAVAAKPKMEGMVELTRRQREAAGYKVVWRGEAGTAALRHLKKGGAVVMLVDHNLQGPGVAIPFFGKEAHTLLAPARLALQSGAVANTIFCLRQGRGRVRVLCGEPMELAPPPREREERLRREAELALEYTRRIETRARECPGQYLWMHKRWQERSETLPYPS